MGTISVSHTLRAEHLDGTQVRARWPIDAIVWMRSKLFGKSSRELHNLPFGVGVRRPLTVVGEVP